VRLLTHSTFTYKTSYHEHGMNMFLFFTGSFPNCSVCMILAQRFFTQFEIVIINHVILLFRRIANHVANFQRWYAKQCPILVSQVVSNFFCMQFMLSCYLSSSILVSQLLFLASVSISIPSQLSNFTPIPLLLVSHILGYTVNKRLTC
jgi:hypothetical protein